MDVDRVQAVASAPWKQRLNLSLSKTALSPEPGSSSPQAWSRQVLPLPHSCCKCRQGMASRLAQPGHLCHMHKESKCIITQLVLGFVGEETGLEQGEGMRLLPGFHPSLKSGNNSIVYGHHLSFPSAMGAPGVAAPAAAWALCVCPYPAGPRGCPALAVAMCAEQVVQWGACVAERCS